MYSIKSLNPSVRASYTPSPSATARRDVEDRDQSLATWQCRVAPSKTHRALLLLAASGALVAIAISEIAIPLQLLLCLGVCTACIYHWRILSLPVTLIHRGGTEGSVNEWEIQSPQQSPFSAKLMAKGYRSASLLVLAFKPTDAGGLHYIPVWRDAITRAQFSYLNLQLMFNTHNN